MDSVSNARDTRTALREMLGYLNFSSGAPDARFQRNLNTVYSSLLDTSETAAAPWRGVGGCLAGTTPGAARLLRRIF